MHVRDVKPVKRLIVFDLDGTLAESKSVIDPEMAGLIDSLLGVLNVAVISGGMANDGCGDVKRNVGSPPPFTGSNSLPRYVAC